MTDHTNRCRQRLADRHRGQIIIKADKVLQRQTKNNRDRQRQAEADKD
jgi:hypothetical protein